MTEAERDVVLFAKHERALVRAPTRAQVGVARVVEADEKRPATATKKQEDEKEKTERDQNKRNECVVAA